MRFRIRNGAMAFLNVYVTYNGSPLISIGTLFNEF